MQNPSDQRGFTLIEVLVVVAIIGLLIAIFVPSLARARRNVRSTVCLSHLMSIGRGMAAYQADFRGRLPVGPADKLLYIDQSGNIDIEPGLGRSPCPWLPWQLGGKRGARVYDIIHFPPQPETLKRPLTDYLYRGASLDTPTPLFECPDDDGTGPRGTAAFDGHPIYYACGNSYWINPWMCGETEVGTLRDKNTSRIVLMEEAPLYWLALAEHPGLQSNGWHGRFSRHNVLFLDFHAEAKYMDTQKLYGPGWSIESYLNIIASSR